MAQYEIGHYLFEVIGQGFAESKNKGTPFFFLEGEPIAIFKDGRQIDVERRLRRIDLYLTDATVEKVRDKLRHAGWTGTRWAALEPDSRDADAFSFVGKQLEVNCSHKASVLDPTQLFDNWDLPFGNQEPTVSDSKLARKIDTLFGKALKSGGKSASPKPVAQRPPEPAPEVVGPPPGDDIPF